MRYETFGKSCAVVILKAAKVRIRVKWMPMRDDRSCGSIRRAEVFSSSRKNTAKKENKKN